MIGLRTAVYAVDNLPLTSIPACMCFSCASRMTLIWFCLDSLEKGLCLGHVFGLNPVEKIEGLFGIHYFILFDRNEFNDMISYHFGKSTEMIGYLIGIKVRHEIKNYEIL
jgi:hypothetical protein